MTSFSSLTENSSGGDRTFFVSTFLNSPVIDVAAKAFVEEWTTRVDGKFRNLCRRVRQSSPSSAAIPCLVSPEEYFSFLHNKVLDNISIRSEVSAGVSVMASIYEEVSAGLQDAEINLPPMPNMTTGPMIDNYTHMRFWEAPLGAYKIHRERGGTSEFDYQTERGRFFTNGKVWVLRSSASDTLHLLTHDQMCMFKDMYYSRYQVLAAAQWTETEAMIALIQRQWDWQMSCLTRYGNRGYEIAKNTEALAKAFLVRRTGDVLAGPGDSYDEMLCKVRRKEWDLSPLLPYAMVDVHRLILEETINDLQVTQLFGLQKLCGHPTIDPHLGGRSSAEQARSPDATTYIDAKETAACFQYLFVMGFCKRYRRWPKLLVPPAAGTRLYTLWRSGDLSFSRDSFDLSDWFSVEFGKEFELDTFPNYFDLLDDKSLSNEWQDRAAPYSGEPSRTNIRMLLEALSRYTVKPDEVVKLIEQGRIKEAWRIICVHPKEREFKVSARMFAMLVFEMRMFFALHEANLADKILPCLPQLTMVDDRIHTQARFRYMTTPTQGGDITAFVELDLSSWNLRWRPLVVEMVGHQINCLFGTKKVFTTAHQFFASATIMVRVPGLEPDTLRNLTPDETELLWRNHLGGFEGQVQKLWAACTVAMIERGMRGVPISYLLTIQGDNVVVSARKVATRDPRRKQAQDLCRDVILPCERASEDVNQLLKPHECNSACNSVSYSKDLLTNGVERYLALKFASRLFPTTSDDFPSIANNTGAIFSGAAAAAERSEVPYTCYFLAILHAATYMARAYKIERGASPVTKRQIAYTMLKPSVLGGWPVLPFLDFLYKGGGDPLSKAVSSLTLIQRHSSVARQILGEHLIPEYWSSKKGTAELIQDPYGIPTDSPMSPADSVASVSESALRGYAKNVDVLSLISADMSKYKANLVADLSTVRPFVPALLHDVMNVSLAGVADTLKRMFTATRSLQGIARASVGPCLVQKVLESADKQWAYMIKMSGHPESRAYSVPQRKLKGAESANLPGYMVYEHCEMLRSKWGEPAPSSTTSYGLLDFPWWRRRVPNAMHAHAQHPAVIYARGPEVPLLGIKTSEKRSKHGYKLYGTGMPIAALRKLHTIAVHAGGPNFNILIDSVGLTRSNVTLSSVTPLIGSRIGGTCAHRYKADRSDRGCRLVGNENFASYVRHDTDHSGYFSATTLDYALMVQEITIGETGILSLEASTRPMTDHHIAIGVGYVQMTPLDTDPMDMPAPPISRHPPMCHNPLAYVEGRLVRTSGPLTTYPLANFRTFSDGKRSLGLHAILSTARQELQGASKLHGDRAGYGLGIKMDLLELLGAGVEGTLTMIGRALAEEACITALHTKCTASQAVRMVLSNSSESLLLPIERMINHPLLSKDPFVITHGLGESLRYGGAHSSLLLQNQVARISNTYLKNFGSPVYTGKRVLFSSDPPNILSNTLIHMAKLTLAARSISGAENCERWLALVQDSAKETANSEMERVTNVHIALLMVAHQARLGGDIITYEEIHTVVNSRVQLALYDAQEAIRALRECVPPVLTPIPFQDERSIRPCSFTFMSTFAGVPAQTQVSWDSSNLRDRLDLAIRRPRCCPLLNSHSLAAWWQVKGEFKDQQVLIVGSGHGGCAASAFAGGAMSVVGHDLNSDVPTALDINYAPPLVSALGFASRYVQSNATMLTTGDWYDNRVRENLKDDYLGTTALVVDFREGKGSGINLRAVTLAWQTGWDVRVYTRIIARTKECQRALGVLQSVCKLERIWVIAGGSGVHEIIVRLTPLTGSRYELLEPEGNSLGVLVGSRECEVCPEDRQLFLAKMLGYYAPFGIKLTEAYLRNVCKLIEKEVGSRRLRERYESWSGYLSIWHVCKVLLLPRAERKKYLREVIYKESIDLAKNVHYVVNWEHLYMLIDYCLNFPLN